MVSTRRGGSTETDGNLFITSSTLTNNNNTRRKRSILYSKIMSSFLLCGPCSGSVSSSSLLLSSRRHATGGDDGSTSFSKVLATHRRRHTAGGGKNALKKIMSMGNVNEGGVFAPLVVAIRPIIGVKRFNQLRGKAISLHSQVIGDFCSEFGATTKQRQKLIKTAKANGGRLGFLA